jgi:acyl-CoA synthetase (AMP-forming)/AMP-acid ligase II
VKAAIDDPRRFIKSKTVGAHFGLTARRIQTGDSIDIEGHISKCGDGEVRTVLYEASSAMLVRSKQWCSVKAWVAAREKITYSILVSTIYTLCVMSPELSAHDLSSWRIGCFGGAPMPVATIEMLAEKLPHLQLLNAYGATETTSPSTIMPRTRWRDHYDSVGITVPCGQIKVVDDDGVEAPSELWIAGPAGLLGPSRCQQQRIH